MSGDTLRYTGCRCFRSRIVCATLSGKKLRIDKIRADDEEPGIRNFEASFLRLIDQLTNGCSIRINETGTKLNYNPGIVINGNILHDCEGRSIPWFIEGVLPLALFGKRALRVLFTGMTNDEHDFSIDTIRMITIPLLEKFGIEGATISIKKRGAAPFGGGEVELFIPQMRELRPFHMIDYGLIKRVRGVAFSCKVSPQVCNRVVASARGVLNQFLPDVWIYTDHTAGVRSGKSAGFGCSLVAETTSGICVSADVTALAGTIPETLGEEAAFSLLREIQEGGCVDSSHQSLVFTLMALTVGDVSRVVVGALSKQGIQTLQLLRDAFGVVFQVKKVEGDTEATRLSCVGSDYKNTARRVA